MKSNNMARNIKRIIWSGVLTGMIFGGSSKCVAQGKELHLDNIAGTKIRIEIHEGSFGDVVDRLISKYNIVVGFEESTLDRDHNDYDFLTTIPPKIETTLYRSDGSAAVMVSGKQVFIAKVHKLTLNFENEKLSKVLDSIVSQMDNYKWEINDGVVNIIPTKGRDKNFENLLSLEIKSFYLGEDASRGRVRHQIKILPEVKKFLDENGLRTNGFRTGGVYGDSQRPVGYKFDFSNLTLRQLLNKIAKTKGGGWILKKQDIGPIDDDPRLVIEFDI